MKKTLLTIVLQILATILIIAQENSITGIVKNNKTQEIIPGAIIVITKTAQATSSDFNGKYSLENIKPGNYELTCTYLSYKKVTKSILIEENQTLTINFNLKEDAVSLTEVKIEAKTIQNTSNSMILHQKKSMSVLSGVSSQEMSMFGDNNAASSLKRVSGISVQDGKYIYVRGLGDRYTKTDVNGIEIPSLDPERNTVQMDLFPSNIIDNILVYKTFSPHLPANFTGGYVNIITKEFPTKFNFSYSSSIGYNSQANFRNDFLSYNGGKLDYFGFDDGTRSIPTSAQNDVPFRYENDKLLNEITSSFGNNMKPVKSKSLMNQSQAFSIGNSTKLFGKKFGYFLSASFNKSYKYYSNGENGKYVLTRADAPFLQKDYSFSDEKGTENALMGILANTSLKINDDNKISLNFIMNHAGEKTARFQEGYNLYHEVYMQTRTMQFSERNFWATQLKGESILPSLNNLKVNWISSYSVSKQNEPDLRFFTNIFQVFEQDTVFSIDIAKQDLPARYFRDMFENSFSNKIDFEMGIAQNSKIAFGFSNVLKIRTFREKLFMYADNNNSFAGDINEYLSEENIGTNTIASTGNFGVYISDNSQLSNSYDGVMQIYSSYIMGEFSLSSKLKSIAGVRAEKSSIFVSSLNLSNPEGNENNLDFLPAISFTYNSSTKTNIKVAYSKTLARPSFRELAPYASFEFAGDFIFVGNENLQETKIDNLDLRWEFYPGYGQVISLGYFHKRFINPIERTFNPEASNNELTLENAETANVDGFEAEIKLKAGKNGFLNNIFWGGNFTYVNSIVAISENELAAIRATNPLQGPNREMYGQAPYIVNAFLMFNNKKTGTQANFSYNISGDKLAIVVKGGTPNIYEKARNQANFNLFQKTGKKTTIKLSVSNIFNAGYTKTYTYKKVEYIHSSYSLGRTFSFGVKYNIN